MKRSFRRKIIVGFWLMVFLCFFIGSLAFITTFNMQKVFHDTLRENVFSLKAAEELEVALLSQKGFMANYFLSGGDPSWLDMLEETKKDFADWFGQASDMAFTPPEQAIIRDIDILYGKYEGERQRAKQLFDSGDIQAAKDVLLSDMSASLEAVNLKCEDYILVNEVLIVKSQAAMQRKVRGIMLAIFFVSIAITGLVGIMFILLAKRILGAIERLAVTARNIDLKNLSGRVDTVNLEEEIEGLACSLNAMLERLEQSFEYIKEFSWSIGHELKTPLAIIKGESEIALRRERQAADYKKALSVNIEEANRMIRIVEDLVFLTKLDYNPVNIKTEIFDAVEFFKDMGARAQTLCLQKQIDFSAAMPEGVILLNGNKLHLGRLFFNLIQNAVKFTPPGGRIALEVRRQDGVLRVSVSDTGCGIDEEELPRIFERFFHKENCGQESDGGIGLGLSIAGSIARFHNGDIEVQSRPAEGATFTVILPIHS